MSLMDTIKEKIKDYNENQEQEREFQKELRNIRMEESKKYRRKLEADKVHQRYQDKLKAMKAPNKDDERFWKGLDELI